MPNLCKLDVSDNQLVDLQIGLSHLELVSEPKTKCVHSTYEITTTLLSIECKSNDSLRVPPREIIASGGEKVATYLKRFARAQKRKSLEESVAFLQKERERRRGHDIEPLPSVALAAINEEHGEAAELHNAEINVSTPDSSVPSQLTPHDPQVRELSADLQQDLQQDLLEEAERQLKTMGEPEANDLEFNKSLRLVAIGTNEPSLSTLLDLLNRVCCSNTSEHGRCQWVFGESSEGCLENHNSELTLKVDRIRRELLHAPSSSDGRECGPASFKTLKSFSDQHQLQHLWKTHRAVFLLAWQIYPNVKDGGLNDLEISAAVHTIQMVRKNCPHSQIFVVPTVLKETSMSKVEDLIAQLRQRLSEQDDERLQFFGGGAICTQQDCEQPEQIEKLKANLHAWAMTSPFYNELLPTCVLSLHDILSDRMRNGSLFITWEEYSSLARSSGVPSSVEDIRVATAMLQDIGALRYFGYDVKAGNHRTRLSVCLMSTVFLSWDWMMGVVERVVDADTTKMITYFSDCDSSLAFLASMLVSDGILHSRLLPFIWPCLDAREEWPGVDSEMIVSFWEHFKKDSSNRASCYSQALIGTERATLERAYAVLIGFHFALVDANEVLYDELEQMSGRLRGLKYFNKSFKCSSGEDDVGMSRHVIHSDLESRTFMPTIVVPRLSIRSRKGNGNDDTNLTFETRHVHFPGPGDHFHALAVYEVLTITLGSESDLQPTSQSSPTAKQSVYDFTSSTYVRVPQEAHGKQVDVSLRRTLQISLKRHAKESPLYIGFAAILDLPDQEKPSPLLSASQKTISDVLKNIPSALISSSSVRAVHHLILYRAPVSSSMIGQVRADGIDKLVEVTFAKSFAKLLEARKEFERHLCYLLLSHSKGVGLVKSLIHGDSPSDFLTSIEKLYFENASVTSESELGPAIESLKGYLVSLDISNNPALKKIPSKELSSIRSLKYLECMGSPKVRAIPPEVAKLGGVQALEYLQSAASENEENKELQIIVLGSGEAGKSSLINCITSGNNKSVKIHEDARTVGIEIREWNPAAFEIRAEDLGAGDQGKDLSNQPNRPPHVPHNVEPDGLKCNFLDLAGQAVYSSSNQFFLVPRALYLVAWRVLEPSKHDNMAKMQELEKMIVNWLDSLQVRVPGCSIVMVATHIDAAAPSSDGNMSKASKAEWAEIDLQCTYVQKIVSRTLRRIRHEANKAGVTPLEVYAHGQSLKVQCLEGFGIKNLRRTLIEMAHSLPSWKELIPKSYNQLRREIKKLGEQETDPKVWLTWEDYEKLAERFNVTGRNLAIATTFLNDMAVIKYFGTVTPEGHPEDEKDVLDNTVFTSPAWIIDGLKGLIRHDRDILIEYCHSEPSESKRVMLRQVNRLALHGTCDSKLVPFLWPGGPGTDPSSQKYWNWLKENQRKDELRLWPGLENGLPFAQSEDDYKRVIALLTGCDFVYKHAHISTTAPERGEYVAPVLLTHDNSLDARSLDTDCQIKHEYHITGIAAGFFDRLLVRAQQGYSHVEHSKTAGVFYGRGLKAQIFLVQHQSASAKNSNKVMKSSAVTVARMPRSTIAPSRKVWTGSTFPPRLRASQADAPPRACLMSAWDAPGASMLRYYDEDTPEDSADSEHVQSVLTVLTSTRRQQVYIAKAIRDLHDFFPGMSIGPYPSEAMLFANRELAKMEPVHIRIAALSPEKAEKVKKLLLDADKELDQAHERQRFKCRLQLRIDAGIVDLERGEGEERNSEKYMDFDSRVVLVCVEKFGDVGRDVKEVGNLGFQLTTYEEKYGCVGRILDENMLSVLKMHLSEKEPTMKRRAGDKSCKHKKPHGLCEDCCSDEAFVLFQDRRQYDAARQKLCEAVLVREFRVRRV
jgi:GTPase SAR1 family protein